MSGVDLHLFVKMISGNKTLVLHCNSLDTIEMVHRKIESKTGIPISELGLIYMGKQLQCDHTLGFYSIQNDSTLHLVCRMRSTQHPLAWELINQLISHVSHICNNNQLIHNLSADVKDLVNRFISQPLIPSSKIRYCRIFMEASAPKALVLLYTSPNKCYQECANDCIRSFLGFLKDSKPEPEDKPYIATIVLQFCRLLTNAPTPNNSLFLHSRTLLASMLPNIQLTTDAKLASITIQDIFPFFKELGNTLVNNLSNNSPLIDVSDFSAFLKPILGFFQLNPVGQEFDYLFILCNELFSCIQKCLSQCQTKRGKNCSYGWSQYLAILKQLNSISLLYPNSIQQFSTMMIQYKAVVSDLVVEYAEHTDDHAWLLNHKGALDFESRRHLAMFMFPEVREDYEEVVEMLIDRSKLLAESFEYISEAESSSLRVGLFMEFENEEATGPGVLREWFCLVCQAIFDPQNALFTACPLDRGRFFPNRASKIDPLHLRYFRFSGRVIALALMHKIQVGIVLDRVFFMQLAGRHVSVDDIQDADPYMYNSCKQILEMDAEFVDSDSLSLTFVAEFEEFGSRKVVELCSGGKEIAVNSKNRKEYVNLIVQHHFVTPITAQVSSFCYGFADILRDVKLRKTFFESLEPEDLDLMLRGSGSEISMKDWKAHTEYCGYRKSDPQIVWFWEIVGKLNAEQKRTLLFFWTSVKYLPVEGFRGLVSKLFINKSLEAASSSRLPTSYTCFYRLHIPAYPSKAVMRERLLVITQEHVGCSFGSR